MGEVWTLLVKALLEYGAFGLLTIAGWGLVGFFFYRDFKKKNEVDESIKAKDALIADKDKEIKELNQARIKDLKETTEDYNEAITNVNHTMDKLTLALQVKTTVE